MERKLPTTSPESRDAKSIRYSPGEWRMFTEAAVLRDVEPSALARDCSLIGLTVLTTRPLMEAYVRALSGIRPTHTNGVGR